MKRILFLGQLPENVSPSQRFRIEQYKALLQEHQYEYIFQPFISQRYLPYLYKSGFLFTKVMAVIFGFCTRLAGVFKYRNVDFVFVQREASPIGPPLFEWIYAKVLRRKLIFDFDDAIWVPNVSEQNKLAFYVKCFWKIKYICKWAYKVSAGNLFLASWAKQYNTNVVINPTCVDMKARYNQIKDQYTNKVVIGWTGSHSTLPYLDSIYPVLQKLEQQYSFIFLVICNQPPSFNLSSLQFVKWNANTEMKDLLKLNIGVMPLVADAWSEGKCGFKLIQYLALGIPAIASPVGVNKEIINNGENGFLCDSQDEWYRSLATLIEDENKRSEMGIAGRKGMLSRFSVHSNSSNFLSFFTV